jgi:intracellular septation protein
MSLDAWVNFKLFGSLGLTFLFVLAQGLWLGRHMKDPGPAAPPPSDRA